MSRLITPPARRQQGYVLMVVLLMLLLMVLATGAAAPSVLQQGLREKEQETIWRGEQYVRGIRLYFRKHGRLPQDMEQLTDTEDDLRFMRKAYRDPMNREDGSWRLIYIGPGGQLIGSLTQLGTLQLPQQGQPGQQGQQGRPGQPQPPGTPPVQQEDRPPGTPRDPQVPRDPRDPDDPQGGAPPPPKAPVSPDQQVPEGEVIGGNIIGVASKVDQASIIYYRGYGTYRQWEFIWDPAQDAVVTPGQQPQTGQPGQQPPGKTPTPPAKRPN